MCKIKTGKAITTNEDVRNLITGIILRQSKEYKKEYILREVINNMNGAEITMSDFEISCLVNNGLDILGRNGEVSCWGGKYRTTAIP